MVVDGRSKSTGEADGASLKSPQRRGAVEGDGGAGTQDGGVDALGTVDCVGQAIDVGAYEQLLSSLRIKAVSPMVLSEVEVSGVPTASVRGE